MLLDKTHRPWIVGVSIVAIAATAIYFVDAPRHPETGPGGSTVLGITLGSVAYLIMLFCAALGLKKYVPHWRLGKAQTWLRGHIWLGLLITVLVVLHTGITFKDVGRWPLVLWVMLGVVTVSGIAGVFIQQTMPRILWATLRTPRASSRDPNWRPSMNAESPAQTLPELFADCADRAKLLAGRYSGKFNPPPPEPPKPPLDRMKSTDSGMFTFDQPCEPLPAGYVAAGHAVPASSPTAAGTSAVAPKTATPAPAPAAPAPTGAAAPAVIAAAASPAPPAASPAPAAAAAATATVAVAAPKPAAPAAAAPAKPAVPAGPPALKPPVGAEPIRQFYVNTGQPFWAGTGGRALENETQSASVFEALRTACAAHLHQCIDDLEELADRRRMLLRQRRWMTVLHGWLIIHVPVSWAFIIAVGFHAVITLRYGGGPK